MKPDIEAIRRRTFDPDTLDLCDYTESLERELARANDTRHKLLVADEGTEGVATWVARCVCGWQSRLMVEEDADRAAAAHRASVEASRPSALPAAPRST